MLNLILSFILCVAGVVVGLVFIVKTAIIFWGARKNNTRLMNYISTGIISFELFALTWGGCFCFHSIYTLWQFMK